MQDYNQFGAPQAVQFRTLRGLMVDSGTHNREVTRPYTSNFDGGIQEMYMQATNGGKIVNRNSLAQVASAIVQPKAIPDASVNIINGWDMSRILFMFEIEQVGSSLSTVLLGYADKVDVSYNSTLDPNLKLFFNSIITLTCYTQNTPHGMIKRKQVVDNSHILGTSHLNALTPYEYNNGMPNAVYTQRPVDLAHNLSIYDLNGHVVDARSQLMQYSPRKSKRANNSAPQYLSESISKLSNELHAVDLEGGISESPQEVYEAAASTLQETPLNSDNVMRYLITNTNYAQEGFVTWQQLNALFPDLNDHTKYVKQSSNVLRTSEHFTSQAGAFEYWDHTSYETLLATQIVQTIPTFLTQAMLLASTGTFTNDNPGGEPLVHVTGETFVEGFDVTQALQILQHRIVNELMPSLTMYGQRVISVAYNINLLRDAWIAITLDGGARVEYSSPCYADALSAPTCVTNVMSLSDIANTVSVLASIE